MTLRILYVGMLPPHPGGSAISASQLLIGFANLGHQVHAVAAITAAAQEQGDAFAARHPEIALTRYLISTPFTKVFKPPSDEYLRQEDASVRNLLPALIARQRPDLIFLGREIFALYVPDLAREHGLPCVLRAAGGATFGLVVGAYPPPQRDMLIGAMSKVDLIITPARHMLANYREWGIPQVKAIMNAVDLERFAPRPKDESLLRRLRLAGDDTVVVLVSNLNVRKRPLDLVDAAAKALQANPRLVFLVVGDGELRSAMEAQCRKQAVIERFRFIGWVDYDDVPDYINLGDVIVMLSEGEGLARVYLEAQACGKLLLASDIAPAREVVTDGETGLLFRLKDIDDLTAKILRAAADAELRLRIGAQARQRVQLHSLDRAVARYLEVFQDVVRQHRSEPADAIAP